MYRNYYVLFTDGTHVEIEDAELSSTEKTLIFFEAHFGSIITFRKYDVLAVIERGTEVYREDD